MFCAFTRHRYQVSVYRTIGPLVSLFLSTVLKLETDLCELFISICHLKH